MRFYMPRNHCIHLLQSSTMRVSEDRAAVRRDRLPGGPKQTASATLRVLVANRGEFGVVDGADRALDGSLAAGPIE